MSSSLEWNKIAGAVLVALLTVKVIDVVGEKVYHPKKLEKNVLEIAGVENQGAPQQNNAPPAKQEEPIAARLAKADAAAGKKSFSKCLVCHTDQKGGPNKIGPNLWGVVGAKKDARSDYQYSGVLAKKGGNWTFDDLDKWLTKPSAFAPGTKMTFAGDPSGQDRANIIAYLRTQSDSPVPLPAAPSGDQSQQPSSQGQGQGQSQQQAPSK
jgi:cytochrome c